MRAKELYGANKVISCHLGGSSSVCAVKDGWSVDTSMGMSPQSGLLNAKRVGDLDPFALLYIMEKENLSPKEVGDVLMSKGGIYGLSGISGDFRDIEENMLKGHKRAELAFKTFAYYVKRYISIRWALFQVLLGFVEAFLQSLFCNGDLEEIFNFRKYSILDEKKNNANPKEGLISSDDSKIKIAIIPTNEEYIVAHEVKSYLEKH